MNTSLDLIAAHPTGTPLQLWNASRHLAAVPEIDISRLAPPGTRAVIVAPHPDDEVLGTGGLIQMLARQGTPILLISVTDGRASHPGSPYWTEHRLAVARPQESAEALRRLGLQQDQFKWLRAGLPDTGVARHEEELKQFLLKYLQPTDVLFATWHEDGHSDHEATGRAALAAGMAAGVLVHEVPIWAWHWAGPEDLRIPWARARKLRLDHETQARKRHASQAFASQVLADPVTGVEPQLSVTTLERLQQPFELVFL